VRCIGRYSSIASSQQQQDNTAVIAEGQEQQLQPDWYPTYSNAPALRPGYDYG
jgi:predicted FMN-binding regulatory protein PaiB